MERLIGIQVKANGGPYKVPESIIWANGKEYPIESVECVRPAALCGSPINGIRYTVVVKGARRNLYLEVSSPDAPWYLETERIS